MYIKYKRTAFVEIPKCASTSVKSILSKFFAVGDDNPHITLQQYKERYTDITSSVCIIREPVERLNSAIGHSIRISNSFNSKDFVENLMRSVGKLKKPSPPEIFFYPQYSFLMSDVPLKIYTLKSIESLIYDLGLWGELPMENSSPPKFNMNFSATDINQELIEELYYIDYCLYNEIMSSPTLTLELENPLKFITAIR